MTNFVPNLIIYVIKFIRDMWEEYKKREGGKVKQGEGKNLNIGTKLVQRGNTILINSWKRKTYLIL